MINVRFFSVAIFIFLFQNYIIAQSTFPLKVSVRWGEVQKIKTYYADPYFEQVGDSLYLDCHRVASRNKEGHAVEYFRRFSFDRENLSCSFLYEDKEYHKKYGTDNYLIYYWIPNYWESLKSQIAFGSSLIPDKPFIHRFDFSSRNNASDTFSIEINEAQTLDYVEVNNELFITIDDSVSAKIIRYNQSGERNEYVFNAKDISQKKFEYLCTYFPEQSNSNIVRRYNIIKQSKDDYADIFLVRIDFDLVQNKISSKKYKMVTNVRFSKQIVSCYMSDVIQENGDLKEFCFSVARLVEKFNGTSYTYYYTYSPPTLFKMNDDELDKIYTFKSGQLMGNFAPLAGLSHFRGGYLFFGSGYTNHYKSLKNVDYSETGDSGSMPHIIINYVDKDTNVNYKLLNVNGIKNLFGSYFIPSPESTDEKFQAYVAVYSGRNKKAVRIGEITIE